MGVERRKLRVRRTENALSLHLILFSSPGNFCASASDARLEPWKSIERDGRKDEWLVGGETKRVAEEREDWKN